VTELEINRIKDKRNQAVLKLVELCQSIDDEEFITLDFLLDKLLRVQLSLPEKSLGKEPYEFLN
jgi:hypothetical protein